MWGYGSNVLSPSPATAPRVEADSVRSSPVLEPALAVESVAIAARGGPVPRRGVVTAGDIDDGLNLAVFQRYAASASARMGLPLADLSQPVLARETGRPGHHELRESGACGLSRGGGR